MVVAVVALFIALGGIASAKAIGLIDGNNIKPGTIGHAQLARRSVSSNNIAKGAVHSDNIAPSLLAHIMGNKSPSVGAAGGQGSQGPQGSKGDKGDKGDRGDKGDMGPAGVGNPLTFSYAGAHSGDSGDCGNDWANDSYGVVIVIQPNADGSYTVQKYIDGTFVTIAGVSQPNPSGGCPGANQTGGVNGTFKGVETWTVPSPGAGLAASFDPTASCGTCAGATSSETQNKDFTEAFFGAGAYGGVTNFDFVYHTSGNGSWVDSNTPANNTGNITG